MKTDPIDRVYLRERLLSSWRSLDAVKYCLRNMDEVRLLSFSGDRNAMVSYAVLLSAVEREEEAQWWYLQGILFRPERHVGNFDYTVREMKPEWKGKTIDSRNQGAFIVDRAENGDELCRALVLESLALQGCDLKRYDWSGVDYQKILSCARSEIWKIDKDVAQEVETFMRPRIAEEQAWEQRITKATAVFASLKKQCGDSCLYCGKKVKDYSCSFYEAMTLFGQVNWEFRNETFHFYLPVCRECAQQNSKKLEELQLRLEKYKSQGCLVSLGRFLVGLGGRVRELEQEIAALKFPVPGLRDISPIAKFLKSEGCRIGEPSSRTDFVKF